MSFQTIAAQGGGQVPRGATGGSMGSTTPGSPRTPRAVTRSIFGVILRPETYLHALYLLVSFPLGIAYFVTLVTVIAVSGGLSITLVGIPMLIAAMFAWCYLGEFERFIGNTLLGARIAPLGFSYEAGAPWTWSGIKDRFTNWMTWRVLAHLFIQFPLGIAGFVILVGSIALPLSFFTSIFTFGLRDGHGGPNGWQIDTFWEALPLTLISPFLFIGGLHLINLAAYLVSWEYRLLLGTRAAGDSAGEPTVGERARAALGAWNRPSAPVVIDEGTPQPNPPAAPSARADPPPSPDPLSVDVAMRVVRVNGDPVELTPKEFDLLALFAQNPGRPFSRDELLDRIWKNDYEVTDRTIDTHIQRLRKKLGDGATAIQTIWGVGYRFQSPPQE